MLPGDEIFLTILSPSFVFLRMQDYKTEGEFFLQRLLTSSAGFN